MTHEEILLQEYIEAHADVFDHTVNADRRREARRVLPDLKSRILELMEKGGRYIGLED